MADNTNNDNKKQLTDKQREFCNQYLIDFNSTQAAIRAGYSEKTAYSIGNENLKKPEIQEYLTVLKAERAERVQISQDRVLEELQHIAFDNISNYLEFKTIQSKVGTDKEGEPIIDYRPVVDIKDSCDLDTRNIAEISISANGTFKFKLGDKQGALTLLGKHLGIFEDNLNVKGAIQFNSGGLKQTLEALKRED